MCARCTRWRRTYLAFRIWTHTVHWKAQKSDISVTYNFSWLLVCTFSLHTVLHCTRYVQLRHCLPPLCLSWERQSVTLIAPFVVLKFPQGSLIHRHPMTALTWTYPSMFVTVFFCRTESTLHFIPSFLAFSAQNHPLFPLNYLWIISRYKTAIFLVFSKCIFTAYTPIIFKYSLSLTLPSLQITKVQYFL